MERLHPLFSSLYRTAIVPWCMTGLILVAVAGTIAAGLDTSTLQPPEAFVGTLTQITVAASLPPPSDKARNGAATGTAPPKDREVEAAKARERAAVRYGR